MIRSGPHCSSPGKFFFLFEGTLALLGGGCAFLAISIIGQPISGFQGSAEHAILTFSAALATALVGAGLWKYCTARIQWISTRRTIGAGVLFGILAHPLAWNLAMILSFIARLIIPSAHFNSLGVDPFSAIFGSIFLSLYSLFLVGWLTLPLSVIMSGALIRLLRRNTPNFLNVQH